jgi:hypothetical protein
MAPLFYLSIKIDADFGEEKVITSVDSGIAYRIAGVTGYF